MLFETTGDPNWDDRCEQWTCHPEALEGLDRLDERTLKTMADQTRSLLRRLLAGHDSMSCYRQLERWFGGICWYMKSVEVRADRVQDEPGGVNRHWDAFIAGYTEWLCRTSGLEPPEWVFHPKRYLDHLWSPEADKMQAPKGGKLFSIPMGSDVVDGAAPWFGTRGVLTSNQALLDSKYYAQKNVAALASFGPPPPLRIPSRTEMGSAEDEGWAVRGLTELAARMEWRRASAWVHLPTVNGRGSAGTVITEKRMGKYIHDPGHPDSGVDMPDLPEYRLIREHNVMRGLESDMAAEYRWPDLWVDKAVYELHDTGCDSIFGHVVWHQPGMTVGCTPVEMLLAIKVMGAENNEDVQAISHLLTTVGIHTEDRLANFLHRWFPHGDQTEIKEPAKKAIVNAILVSNNINNISKGG